MLPKVGTPPENSESFPSEFPSGGIVSGNSGIFEKVEVGIFKEKGSSMFSRFSSLISVIFSNISAIFSASDDIVAEDISGGKVEVVVGLTPSGIAKGSGSMVNLSRLKMSKGIRLIGTY